jgi:hypothetical protein
LELNHGCTGNAGGKAQCDAFLMLAKSDGFDLDVEVRVLGLEALGHVLVERRHFWIAAPDGDGLR